MNDYATPMMRQYMEIKNAYADCLLLFRMGDFYELFMEDAHTGSRILNITLTGKAGGKDGRIPMAGVPYHAVDSYIAKLVKAGYKVAICEQLSPPNKKGLVKRGVVRIVTPGTLLDENTLEKKENNYIISLILNQETISMAIADISTGYFSLLEENPSDLDGELRTLLLRFKPSECLLPDELYNDPTLLKLLHEQRGMNIFPTHHFPESVHDAERTLTKHFRVKTLEGFGIADLKTSLIAGAGLLAYLTETQNGSLPHIKKITREIETDGVILDRSTIMNLELFATLRDHDTRGSLLTVLDETITAMGGRMLKTWVKKPLTDKESIEQRLEAVSFFLANPQTQNKLREALREIPDVERLLARISVNLGNARDLIQLKHALNAILVAKELFAQHTTPFLTNQSAGISPHLHELIGHIENVIVSEPPFSTREGNMIRPGISPELDTLRDSIAASKTWIAHLEGSERKKTGIASLKVRFNKVFGYYIEVSKTNAGLVPAHYFRKQTLVNGERFITEELKKHEEVILTTEEKMNDIEYKVYCDLVEKIVSFTEYVQDAARVIAVYDVLSTFSIISEKYRYTKPVLLYSGELRIKQGRHPVVERMLEDIPFVANDSTLDNTSQSLLIITGPNMAGKSVYIRQVALIVLMAQIGCFVPADSAHISLVDRIFVRSGASDFITSGLSTFMVEMVETAHILNYATSRSLIIMDEIGRGTSTYDGISLAWAVAQFLVTEHTPSPKVLFATHYHELQALEQEYPAHIKNFHMAVTEEQGEPIFLHSLLPGGASHSFGVSVAKLAGLPETVLNRANELLALLEERHMTKELPKLSVPKPQSDLTFSNYLITKELSALDIATMTPLEALNKIAELKEKVTILKAEQLMLNDKD